MEKTGETFMPAPKRQAQKGMKIPPPTSFPSEGVGNRRG